MNEFDFIRRLREQTESRKRSPRVINGIGDDASVIREAGDRDLIITTDLLVEETDFYRDATPPCLLGHKALAVSLSDVAAMGARPRWSMVSIGLPREIWQNSFKELFFAGYFALADQYGVTLVGGDISQSKDRIVIDSIVIGEVTTGGAVLRSTAQPGDQIFVTGNLGGATAGLKLIEMGARVSQTSEVRSQKPEPRAVTTGFHHEANPAEADAIERLLLRQLRPDPRVGWGIVLGQDRLATSMIDISDGLSSDLNHVCGESSVGAIIDAASIPVDKEVSKLCGRRALDPLALALHGGEDFELLFTVHPENIVRLPKRVDGVAISRIGEIAGDLGVRISERNHVWELKAAGFEHFRQPQ
jgi:thiamine-monophosphate kinase